MKNTFIRLIALIGFAVVFQGGQDGAVYAAVNGLPLLSEQEYLSTAGSGR